MVYIEKSVEEYEAENAALRARVAELEKENAGLRRANTQHRETNRRMGEELDTLRARLAELELEVYRPCPVICMCGSTRFKQAWIDVKRILGCAGNIVIGVDLWGHHEHVYPDEQFKTFLDDLHKRKIDLADEVFVLDIDGYVGESTRSEIEYAKMIGRPVRYLSQEMPGYVEPEDPLVRLEQERDEAQARAKRAEGENRALAGLRADDTKAFAVEKQRLVKDAYFEGFYEAVRRPRIKSPWSKGVKYRVNVYFNASKAAAALRGGGK